MTLVQKLRTVKVIQPSGIFNNMNNSQFRQEVIDGLANKAEVILVDFKDVTFIDSSGLGILASALKTVLSAGKELYICSINSQVRMVFELTSLDEVFKILASQEDLSRERYVFI